MGLRKSKRLFGAIMVAGLIGSASYAMTAANDFEDLESKGGQGSHDITGFVVSDVQYTLAANPENYSAVSFDLDGAAGTVRAKVTDIGTTYETCSIVTGMRWTCPISDSVASADELTVIAIQ